MEATDAIIVTGATGFVGRYLVDYLARAGEKVIATGRSRKYDAFFNELRVPCHWTSATPTRLPCFRWDRSRLSSIWRPRSRQR